MSRLQAEFEAMLRGWQARHRVSAVGMFVALYSALMVRAAGLCDESRLIDFIEKRRAVARANEEARWPDY